MAQNYTGPLERVDEVRWRIPRSYKEGMRVDGLIYADDALVEAIKEDKSPDQVANVACLPGIVGHSLAMPDIHWGYGFCIGGVAATDPQQGGVISPGGVGYDINCGVRLLRTNLTHEDVKPRIEKLIDTLFSTVPCGVGKSGNVKFMNLSPFLAWMLESMRETQSAPEDLGDDIKTVFGLSDMATVKKHILTFHQKLVSDGMVLV